MVLMMSDNLASNVFVIPFQTHTDALTTIQLASRIHRMRRRKHRFPLPSDKQLGVNSTGKEMRKKILI